MSRVIEDYQIIEESGKDIIRERIISLSKKGYELCGGYVLNYESKYGRYSQSMVKYKEEPKEEKKDNIKL